MSIKNPITSVLQGLEVSPTLYINELVNQYWREGKTVFHMGFGESRFDVHPKLQQALIDNRHRKSYLSSRGLPELCQQVASYYSDKLSQQIDESQVIIGPGSKALIYAIQAMFDGDVFFPQPSWVSYEPIAKILGKTVFTIPTNPNDGSRFSIDDLDQQINRSTATHKILILNSPNNPTGQMLSKPFIQQLADYCRVNGIWVLSDEIYFLVCENQAEHHSISSFYPEGTFVLGGLSKHLSIGGWRLGVGILPKGDIGSKMMQALISTASETWSAVSAPMQYAAISAYKNDDDIERYIQTCANIHALRSRFIEQQLTDLGVLTTNYEGAFYLTANFDKWAQQCKAIDIRNSGQLATHLLEHHHIATLPGSAFGLPPEQLSLRLSTSYLDFEDDCDSSRILALYESKLSNEAFLNSENHPQIHGAIEAFKDFIQKLV